MVCGTLISTFYRYDERHKTLKYISITYMCIHYSLSPAVMIFNEPKIVWMYCNSFMLLFTAQVLKILHDVCTATLVFNWIFESEKRFLWQVLCYLLSTQIMYLFNKPVTWSKSTCTPNNLSILNTFYVISLSYLTLPKQKVISANYRISF